MADLWSEFHGPVTTAEPLSWGQRSIWKAYTEFRPHTAWLNISRTLAVPSRAAADVAGVTRAVSALLNRHESLRTRIGLVDGELWQVPATTGRIAVRVVESGDAESIKDDMGLLPYDYMHEWPLRVTLLTERGRVTHLALVFSHVAVDLHASEILLRELRLLLLRGAIATPPGLQSVDVARREHGVMKHRTGTACDYWLEHYARLPQSMLTEAGSPLTPRFRRALLVSRALDSAMRVIAARHRVSTATVLLAAASAMVGSWTGQEHCAFFTMVNNRYQDGHHNAVAKLNQLGLFVVDLSDRPDFTRLVPRTWQSAVRAYRHAYYEPAAMDEALTQIGRHTGSAYEPWCYINDSRLPGFDDVEPADSDEAAIRAAMAHTELTWPEALDRFAWRFRLQVLDAPGAVGISITADTAYLPPDDVERFLRQFEQLVVRAAFHDVPWPWRESEWT